MQSSLLEIKKLIGNTKLFKLDIPYCNFYAKLEFQNPFGSIKDRPAFYIINNAVKRKLITPKSIVIESTSGNFGIAVGFICKAIGIKFISVIDPNISSSKENLLNLICDRVIKVTSRDITGGYLLTRIETVKRFISETPYSYNLNQYENEDNFLSHYFGLADELCNDLKQIDYVFISVSSGGTVIGLSIRLKEKFPNIYIVAVDVEGSVIFTNAPKPRVISGLGASIRSPLMDKALIDEIVILTQREIVEGCNELLHRHSVFAGASSGAAYMAGKKVMKGRKNKNANAIFICPDHGSSYIDSIYSIEWVKNNIEKMDYEISK
jgi:N-(2-amino-2-carboxyethyl)-L-glutamate synthase